MFNLPPLVLIPGVMCNERLWSQQQKYFSGKTDVLIPNVLGAESIRDIARRIMANTPAANCNIVGFSSGGYVAQALYEINPGFVNKMVLVSTAGGEFSKRQQTFREGMLRSYESEGAQIAIDKFVGKLNSTYANAHEIQQYNVAMNEEIIRKSGCDVFYNQMAAVVEYNRSAISLREIRCPVLVICADNDPFIPSIAYSELLSEIPHAQFKMIKGGGHMLPISCSAELNSLLTNFFGYPSHDCVNRRCLGNGMQ